MVGGAFAGKFGRPGYTSAGKVPARSIGTMGLLDIAAMLDYFELHFVVFAAGSDQFGHAAVCPGVIISIDVIGFVPFGFANGAQIIVTIKVIVLYVRVEFGYVGKDGFYCRAIGFVFEFDDYEDFFDSIAPVGNVRFIVHFDDCQVG